MNGMNEFVDRWYCTHCQEYIEAASPDVLATRVNNHNTLKHPLDFTYWNGATIVLSAMYSGEKTSDAELRASAERSWEKKDALAVRPESSGSGEWGNAKRPPNITDLEKIWLAGGGVLWDSK